MLDTHGARPNDVTVTEYFAGLGLMSLWSQLIVEKVLKRHFLQVQLVEKDESAKDVLKRVFPGVTIINDIAALENLKPCRLALVGFPCKGTSSWRRIQGNENAIENLDTSMIQHFLRALKDTSNKPHVILLENVRGLLSAWHEGESGGFMRWLILNFRTLGYAGEFKLFSSGDNAFSGDRVFLVCRLEGVTSVCGSLLSLGGARVPKPLNGYGFSKVKRGDAPVAGRLGCITEGYGSPCFVFLDDADGKHKCVEFGVNAVADLFTLTRQNIIGGSKLTDNKVQKMLSAACRPVGKAIIDHVLKCILEVKTAEGIPGGAVQHTGIGPLEIGRASCRERV